MNVFRHENHTVYRLAKNILFFKQHSKIMFWYRGKIVKNHRFKISPHKQWQFFHWFIRLPFFYFERNNGGLYIGTPNKYIQFQKSYRN